MHTESMREKVFNVRFSAEEWARIQALSAHHGVSAAALFRLLLKKEERHVGQTTRANDEQRWSLLKAETLLLLEEAQVPNLHADFDEDARAIILSDGERTEVVNAGEGPYFRLVKWPGSRLEENETAIAKAVGGPWSRLHLATNATWADARAKVLRPSASTAVQAKAKPTRGKK